MAHPATRQIGKAELALNAYRSSGSLDEAEDAWCEFLHHFVRAVNKYDAYGRASNGRAWTRMSVALRADACLCYLWEARNSDEHTVKEVAGRTPGVAFVNPIAIEVGDGLVLDAAGSVGISLGPGVGLTFIPGNLHTVAIRGRDGSEYSRPLENGFPMTPLAIMERGVAFLKSAID